MNAASELLSHESLTPAGGVFIGASPVRPHFDGRATRFDKLDEAEAVLSALVSARGEAAGLVSVSTTCKEVSSAFQWAENCLQIDQAQARVTRLRKGLGVGAKRLHNQGPRNQSMWMLTLTYAPGRDWAAEHISRYLDALRVWHYSRTGSRSLRYAWVAELQKRGAVHYHVVVWLAAGLTPPKPDTAWKHPKKGFQPPMWRHGMSNRLKAVAPVAYLMKYVSKADSKSIGGFPRGARIFGLGGLDQVGRDCKRWVLWPAYVQGNCAAGEPVKPRKGGGYLHHDDGRIFLPEYAPTGGGYRSFIRVRTVPRLVDASGPFSWCPGFVH